MEEEQNSTDKPSGPWLIESSEGIFFLVSLLIFLVGSSLIYERVGLPRSLNWSTVTGRVVVDRKEPADFRLHDVKYQYTLGEQTYTNFHRCVIDGITMLDGTSVKVIYDPKSPIKSRLDLGFSLDILPLALLDVFGVLGMAFSFKEHRRKERIKSGLAKEDDYLEPYYEIESSN